MISILLMQEEIQEEKKEENKKIPVNDKTKEINYGNYIRS